MTLKSLFWKIEKKIQKTGEPFFSTIYIVPISYKTDHMKPMLRQTNCEVQTWPMTKNVVVPLIA